jgi:hypothetical protein
VLAVKVLAAMEMVKVDMDRVNTDMVGITNSVKSTRTRTRTEKAR